MKLSLCASYCCGQLGLSPAEDLWKTKIKLLQHCLAPLSPTSHPGARKLQYQSINSYPSLAERCSQGYQFFTTSVCPSHRGFVTRKSHRVQAGQQQHLCTLQLPHRNICLRRNELVDVSNTGVPESPRENPQNYNELGNICTQTVVGKVRKGRVSVENKYCSWSYKSSKKPQGTLSPKSQTVWTEKDL